jgi:hypothetical protein
MIYLRLSEATTHVTLERSQRLQHRVSQSFESETHVMETSEREHSV